MEIEIIEPRNKKEEIMRCAIKLFFAKGFYETSMEDICNCAGITKGTLYYYINSKDELLFEIHDRYITAVIKRAEGVLKKLKNMSSKEKIKGIIEVHARVMHDFKDEITVFFKEMDALSPERFKLIADKREEYFNLVYRVIEDGISKGEFKNINPKIVCLSLLGMLNWMYQWYNPKGKLNVEEIAEIMKEVILNGILIK